MDRTINGWDSDGMWEYCECLVSEFSYNLAYEYDKSFKSGPVQKKTRYLQYHGKEELDAIAPSDDIFNNAHVIISVMQDIDDNIAIIMESYAAASISSSLWTL